MGNVCVVGSAMGWITDRMGYGMNGYERRMGIWMGRVWLVGGIAAAMLFGLAMGIADAAYGDDNPGLNYGYADEIGVMSQDEFPCQEDEVIGYSPEFGPGMVGCIHIDSIV